MEKSIESSLPVWMWLKVVIYLHLVWQPLLNHLVVLKQSAVVGNTFTGHESSVPEDASVTRLCLTKCFLDWIDQCEHQTRLPLPMTCKRVSVLSESSLINLKCNSKTNTTVTLTKSSVLWVLRGRLEIHLPHLDFALDVDWHCLPILKTPDETPDVLDVGVQDGQQDPQEAILFCWASLQLTNLLAPSANTALL